MIHVNSLLHYVQLSPHYTEDCEVLAINNINGSLFDWLYLQDIANQIYGTLVIRFLIFNCIARFHRIPVILY